MPNRTLRLSKFNVIANGEKLAIDSRVTPPEDSASNLPTHLVIHVPSWTKDLLSIDRMDALALAFLIPAMERSWNLHLEGPMCPLLFDTIQTKTIPLLVKYFPGFPNIDISCEGFAPPMPPVPERCAATGLSGGVDSFYTISRYQNPIDDFLKIGLFFFNDVGQFGRNSRWEIRSWDIAQNIANSVGIPAIHAQTNLNEFYKNNFMRSHSLRNISIPLLYQRALGVFYHNATYSIDRVHPKMDDIADIDPILTPLCSTASLRVLLAGSEKTRAEKLAVITDRKEVCSSLFVCINCDWNGAKPNCSRCSKCTRTIVFLHCLGLIDQYEKAFDIQEIKNSPGAVFRRFYASATEDWRSQASAAARATSTRIPGWWKFQGRVCRLIYQLAPAALKWRLRVWFPQTFVD